jgi:ethanolamine-phosphate cytidylyltransferase
VAAVDACRWVTHSVPHAPYVTLLPWVSHYGCRFVGHGDDVTSDGAGEDCYRFVKAAGRFKVFKRTPGISTTDLVGRMLLCSRAHFVRSLTDLLAGREGEGPEEERRRRGEDMFARLRDYATDASGFRPGCEVWSWAPPAAADDDCAAAGAAHQMAAGKPPRPGQRVVYVDGGFDLFSSGHIEFLRRVRAAEDGLGRARGWFEPAAAERRVAEHGEDYPPAYVLAGVHDDAIINRFKGVNYPIMNIFERGLCVLQCKVRPPPPSFFSHCLTSPSTSTPSSSPHPSPRRPGTCARCRTACPRPSTTGRRPSCRSTRTPTSTPSGSASSARSSCTTSRTSTPVRSCSAS